MTTLRDAAAQVLNTLEQLNSSLHLLDCYKAFDAEITILEAALEQHDEDVAFMTDRYDNWRRQKELVEANAAMEQPQNPTPPRREWRGLTDEEIYEAEDSAGRSFRHHRMSIRGQMITPADNFNWHFARAIEAKLKELNHE